MYGNNFNNGNLILYMIILKDKNCILLAGMLFYLVNNTFNMQNECTLLFMPWLTLFIHCPCFLNKEFQKDSFNVEGEQEGI